MKEVADNNKNVSKIIGFVPERVENITRKAECDGYQYLLSFQQCLVINVWFKMLKNYHGKSNFSGARTLYHTI